MKKEINFKFKKIESKCDIDKLYIVVYANDKRIDHCILGKDFVIKSLMEMSCIVIGMGHTNIASYIEIPEIKALHDEHFKKEVDLFGFVETQEYAFAVDVYGKVFGLLTTNEIIEKFKKNYNLLPKGTLAENASVMSLDERKQYLFAIAKGYEVLTREEALELSEFDWRGVISLFRNKNNKFEVNGNSLDATSNIYFKKSKHAQECADWMN